MKKLIQQIKCFFGWHDYKYLDNIDAIEYIFKCPCCGKDKKIGRSVILGWRCGNKEEEKLSHIYFKWCERIMLNNQNPVKK